jgi:hypothetical protein
MKAIKHFWNLKGISKCKRISANLYQNFLDIFSQNRKTSIKTHTEFQGITNSKNKLKNKKTGKFTLPRLQNYKAEVIKTA